MTNDVVRKLMYGDDETSKKKESKPKSVNISETHKTIIIENNGTRYQLPSARAVDDLIRENNRLKNELVQAKTDIKKLTEAIKKMDNNMREIERVLLTKADIYGD